MESTRPNTHGPFIQSKIVFCLLFEYSIIRQTWLDDWSKPGQGVSGTDILCRDGEKSPSTIDIPMYLAVRYGSLRFGLFFIHSLGEQTFSGRGMKRYANWMQCSYLVITSSMPSYGRPSSVFTSTESRVQNSRVWSTAHVPSSHCQIPQSQKANLHRRGAQC